jgi:hypothetical protein
MLSTVSRATPAPVKDLGHRVDRLRVLAEDAEERDHHQERREQRQQREKGERRGPVEQFVVLELSDRALERGNPGAAGQLGHEIDRVHRGVEALALGRVTVGRAHRTPSSRSSDHTAGGATTRRIARARPLLRLPGRAAPSSARLVIPWGR